jgi:hypothetical protein
MASAYILSRVLDMDYKVCWIPEKVAPAQPSEIFDSKFLADFFVSKHDIEANYNVNLTKIPKYLNSSANLITLRGLDRGEQRFIKRLVSTYKYSRSADILIMGGSDFYYKKVLNYENFILRKREFYTYVKLDANLDKLFADISRLIPTNYISMHLRAKDRRFEFPSKRKIKKSILLFTNLTGIKNFFIASDDAKVSEKWGSVINDLNLSSYSLRQIPLNHIKLKSTQLIFLDWLFLSNSTYLISTGESTFSKEAIMFSKSILGTINLKSNIIILSLMKLYISFRTNLYVKLFFK